MASCHKEDANLLQIDPDGVVFSLPYQWKKSLHNNKEFNSNGYISNAVYYKGNFAIPTTDGENNRFLTLINPDNGEIIWNWNDSYLPYSNQIEIFHHYQFNNLLTYQVGSKSYCVNLETGTTQWKFQRDSSFGSRLYPSIDNNFFNKVSIIDASGYGETTVNKTDINTGDITKEVIRANYAGDYINPNNLIGAITNVIKLPNSTNLYAITYAEPSPNWVVNTYLGLYDDSTKAWIYERKLMAPPTQNSSAYEPKIYNGKLYAWVGKNIVCHNLETGEQIWRKPFPQDFLFSGFIIEDDKIIANNEDTFTYGIHPENGNILWKTESAGTSGRISYLNGIAYFVGGSTGKLHAIDTETGQHVWKLEASSLGEPAGNSFKTNAVYVFPPKNGNAAKVIALSHLNAYSFEAYQ
jgi:outer membrane protein assembly factor BamB